MPARWRFRTKTAMAKNDDATPLRPKPRAPSLRRVAAFQTGISAESKACLYLIAKGYRILARRFRTPHGEIDVVARHRNCLVFLEVKARGELDDAAYAVTPRQQQRIATAAQVWLMTHPDHANLDCRFDVILIAPKHLPRHLKAAFDAGG
jgi:putative endonuclease